MQFLKTLFWVIAAIILAAFAHGNWTPVTISLWAGLVLETKLPLIVLGSILIGFVPPYAMLRAARWRMRRRLDEIDRKAAVPPEPVPADISAALPSTPSEP